jgi:hypothetical protein
MSEGRQMEGVEPIAEDRTNGESILLDPGRSIQHSSLPTPDSNLMRKHTLPFHRIPNLLTHLQRRGMVTKRLNYRLAASLRPHNRDRHQPLPSLGATSFELTSGKMSVCSKGSLSMEGLRNCWKVIFIPVCRLANGRQFLGGTFGWQEELQKTRSSLGAEGAISHYKWNPHPWPPGSHFLDDAARGRNEPQQSGVVE